MKSTAPTKPTLIIALVCGILGILAFFGIVPPLAPYAFWLVTIGFVLLAIGSLMRGM